MRPSLPQLEVEGLREKLLWGFGYAGFFFTCFALFCYWTFPYDRLRDVILQRANAGAAEGGSYRLDIGELEPHWLTGVEATDVTLTPVDAAEGEALHIASLSAHVSPFAYLAGETDVSFSANVGEGDLDGSYVVGEEGKRIDVEITELDLAELGIGSLAGAPITGHMSGQVQLDLPELASAANGNVNLKIEKLTLGDGKGKLKLPGMRDGFTVEKIDAGTMTIESTIEEGIAAIKTLEAKGDDMQLDAGGTVRLGYPLPRSRLNMTLELAFDDSYKTRNARTKSLFELMSFRPEIKQATGPDGTMRFKLTGPLGNLRTRPAGTGGKAARPARKAKKKSKKAKPAQKR